MDREPLITPAYAEQNRLMHEQNGFFGANGGRYAEQVYGLLAAWHPRTLLDYGCGKRGLERAVKNLVGERRVRQSRVSRSKNKRHWTFQAKLPEWRCYDPAIPGTDTPPRSPADMVVCTDVLEHVEPEHIDATMRTLSDLTGTLALLSFSLRASNKTLPDGRNTHLIVEDRDWWAEMVSRHYRFWSPVPWRNTETFLVVAFK